MDQHLSCFKFPLVKLRAHAMIFETFLKVRRPLLAAAMLLEQL
jgi:hypothetical protein